VLAIIAILVSLGVFLKQRRRKELAFDSIGISVVSPIGGEFGNEIKVFFRDEEVQGLEHFLVTVRHSGNESIKPEDYESDLTLDFGDKARAYECEISVKRPRELNVAPTLENGKVHLGKPLLNPGDRFYMGVLVTNPKDSVDLHARIAGLTRVRREDIGASTGLNPLYPAVPLLVLASIYVGSVAYSLPERATSVESVVSALFVAIAGITLVVVLATLWLRDRIR
jgi:hypothetical protein